MLNKKFLKTLQKEMSLPNLPLYDHNKLLDQKLQAYPIKPGNIMMYYPESNTLVPRQFDSQSKTPAFKSIEVFLEKQS